MFEPILSLWKPISISARTISGALYLTFFFGPLMPLRNFRNGSYFDGLINGYGSATDLLDWVELWGFTWRFMKIQLDERLLAQHVGAG